jgi:hypothetical protein
MSHNQIKAGKIFQLKSQPFYLFFPEIYFIICAVSFWVLVLLTFSVASFSASTW